MSAATDWIGAVGGLIGAASVIWNWLTAGKAEKVKKAAEAAQADATKAMAAAEAAQTQAQVGWLELQLRVFISSRRDKIHDIDGELARLRQGRQPDQLSALEKQHFVDIHDRFLSAYEDFLGALEQACRHFRDAKIDVEAFRLMYDDEIRHVTIEAKENEPFYKQMYPREKSKFKAIWAVSDEWFQLEPKERKKAP